MPDIHTHSDRTASLLPGIEATAVELLSARRPAERGAAWMLAVAHRDLAVVRAFSPAELAEFDRLPGQPWSDPESEYADWMDRMARFEALAREDAVRSVAAGYVFDVRNDRAVGPLADVVAAALRRARAAIGLMFGADEAAADAAHRDVLTDWPVDDRLALLGYGARAAVVDQLLGSAD